jgi:hypothetical protein
LKIFTPLKLPTKELGTFLFQSIGQKGPILALRVNDSSYSQLPNFGVLYSLVLGTFIGGMCCAISG